MSIHSEWVIPTVKFICIRWVHVWLSSSLHSRWLLDIRQHLQRESQSSNLLSTLLTGWVSDNQFNFPLYVTFVNGLFYVPSFPDCGRFRDCHWYCRCCSHTETVSWPFLNKMIRRVIHCLLFFLHPKHNCFWLENYHWSISTRVLGISVIKVKRWIRTVNKSRT